MEKKIIVFCCIILGFVLYNYPIFDNEGISYLIIFCSFIGITFSVSKIFNPSDKNNYESVEKGADHLEDFDGIFSYQKDGFCFSKNKIIEFVKWDEIIEVNSFIIPFLDEERHSGLEIITTKMNYEFNNQQTPGLEKLTNQLIHHLPYWKFDAEIVRINNYGLRKANLYKRN